MRKGTNAPAKKWRSVAGRLKLAPGRAGATIELTGLRHHGRHLVEIDGRPLELTHGLFTTFINLLLGHARSGSGLVAEDRRVICRLRQALDSVLGAGAGEQLIENGMAGEYLLRILGDDLRKAVTLHPPLIQLVERKLLARDRLELLQECCIVVKRGRRRDIPA